MSRPNACRRRRRGGLVALTVTVDEIALAAKLAEIGYLRPCEADDRRALRMTPEAAIGDFTIVTGDA